MSGFVAVLPTHTPTDTLHKSSVYLFIYTTQCRYLLGYSPAVDLAAIGGRQSRDIELYSRVGAFQAIRLVQLLHNMLHLPIDAVIELSIQAVAFHIEK